MGDSNPPEIRMMARPSAAVVSGLTEWPFVLGVFLLTAGANRFRLKPINVQEQFIMAYGGLRGAVSFSLVEMLKADDIKPRQMFVTTTLIVILFTVFVQVNSIVAALHRMLKSFLPKSVDLHSTSSALFRLLAFDLTLSPTYGSFALTRLFLEDLAVNQRLLTCFWKYSMAKYTDE